MSKENLVIETKLSAKIKQVNILFSRIKAECEPVIVKEARLIMQQLHNNMEHIGTVVEGYNNMDIYRENAFNLYQEVYNQLLILNLSRQKHIA